MDIIECAIFLGSPELLIQSQCCIWAAGAWVVLAATNIPTYGSATIYAHTRN